MMGVSSGAVWIAGLVLLSTAALGSYLGYSRALAAPGSSDPDAYAATTPLAAKKASPINDGPAPPPPVDEAYIRKIAHDEATAVLHPPVHHIKVAADSDDSDDDDDKDSGSNPPTPPAPGAASPSAAPKPPPPPTGLY